MAQPTQLFINGELVAPLSQKYFPTFNPATEEVVAKVAEADTQDVDRAVRAAKACFDDGKWSTATGKHRAVVLRAVAKRIADSKAALAKKETINCGKPLKESEWDVDDVVGCFEYFALQAEALDERQNRPVDLGEANNANFKCHLRYEASGVVAAVIPWNYPMLMFAWKVAPALAAGCTVIVKPSELTPLTALDLAQLCHQGGVPKGALNVVTGAGATGEALIKHPSIDKVAFTGSVPTGARVAQAAVKDIKNITLELGGKSAIIVFDDVDIPKAVEWIMFGVFWTNGQICSSTSRLLVHERIAAKLLPVLVKATKEIVIGDPNTKEHGELTGMLGPVVSKGQYQRVMNYINGAVKEGAQVLAGGKRPAHLKKGFFIEPTILKVKPSMTIWKEEVFGPVLSVHTFSSEQEAIRLANDNEFGLAGAVISQDPQRCTRVINALRCGIGWVNCSQPAFVQAPWGGLKKSGVGRELGEQGIFNYLEPKQVTSYVSKDAFGWYKHIPAKL